MRRITRRAAARPLRSRTNIHALAEGIGRALRAPARVAPPRASRPVVLLTAMLLLSGPLPAFAQATWTGAVSSDWYDSANWAGGTPDAGDNVNIDTFTPNPAVISGGNAFTNWLLVGQLAQGNLAIINGATLTSLQSRIGSNTGVQGAVTVSGAGSTWNTGFDFLIGVDGSGSLTVADGGTVNSIGRSRVGFSAGAHGEVTITGADSTWNHSGDLIIGTAGEGELSIADGGAATTGSVVLGSGGGSLGSAVVAGAGSSWTIGHLVAGDFGTGAVRVSDGGTLSSAFTVLGNGAGGGGGNVVTGVGSAWNTTGAFIVGNEGLASLVVTNGGTVASTSGAAIGNGGGQGTVSVLGAGSAWNVAGGLTVGVQGTGYFELLGGALVADSVDVGEAGSGVGSVTLRGAGSNATIGSELVVGDGGTGTLLIAGGGTLRAGGIVLGRQAGAQGTLTVSDPGSVLTHTGTAGALIVGLDGSGTLAITAGGTVDGAGDAVVGAGSGSGTATVTGAGSAWDMDGELIVGNGGTGSLDIADGARVQNTLGWIGGRAGGATTSTGSVTVRGAGSTWINSGFLTVGASAAGSLLIEDGGRVESADAAISDLGSSNGSVVVRDAGSSWSVAGSLLVGGSGGFGDPDRLRIESGGRVESGSAIIGLYNGAGATVSGAGSVWDNAGTLQLASVLSDGSSGGNPDAYLTIADGGRVVSGTVELAGPTSRGIGTLNIGAAAGTAAVAPGFLDTPSVSFGTGSGTGVLNFNHTATDYVFDAALTGSGTLDHLAGTTTLTGLGDASGTLNLDGGTLLVEGALGGMATTVASGATLGGSGAIGGDVTVQDGGILAPGSSAGTLTLGSLSLSAGSILDYELGQAGVVGGGVNDLVEIGGDLILDGTLDVTDIGGFGAGVYRLMNYGGALTDNGLKLGTLPTGSDAQDLFLQTAIGGQVNLVNSAGLTLSFWDGSVGGEHNNDAIDGGAGTWDADNDNWTTDDGALNGRWDDGTFAVFGEGGATVEVVGEQAVAGMQFMSGYTLAAGTGGALRIDGVDSVFRVDPDVTATIETGITGSGGLVKTDTGTLVLSGANTYLGGTTIRTGTLSVSADANLGDAAGGLVFEGGTLQNTAAFDSARDVSIDAAGATFLVDADLGLSGAISGAGALVKDGAGTLVLDGDNSYAGGTRVLAGTLVGDSNSIRGDLDNDGSVVFDQAGSGTFAGAIAGDGTMAKRGAGALTLTGDSALDWAIDAGALLAAAGFGGDASIADGALLRFIRDGDATYAGVLSGAGDFEVGGAGTLVLDGDSSAFAGTTGVDAGVLQVDGALGGGVEVGTGAALSGDGVLGGAVRVLDGGRLAPGAGIGTLTVGSLWLSGGATLDYGLGQAGVVGGTGNDLIEVGGDLTLDGTLDITDVGGFGAGVYRLINYGGTLTDNTLDIGALPDGYEAGDLFLQTAVDGQVNLINSAGAVLGFWDGGAGPADDGSIQGGDGTWTGGDRSWTDANGAINGGWSAGFAVFGGQAGTVTVEGAQAFTGMQFMTDGYRIAGDALAMDTAETIVRVDRDVTATIDSVLTGSGALLKHDAGTLVLSGDNTYTGGTQLLGGVLAVSGDGNLGAAEGALAFDGGSLRLDAAFDSARDIHVGAGGGGFDSGAFDTTLAGAFSGDGTFTRIGSGMLTLVGASHAFGGTFALQSGGLRVDGNLGGLLTIANGALLSGIGTLHDVDNHGTVAAGNSIGILTLTGDYIHRGDATLLAEIEPGGDSDLLDVAGTATIEGGTVQVVKLPGQYEGGTRYTLIDAAGGVTGTFGALEQDLPFLDLLLGYDGNHVYLDVQRSDVGFDIVCGDGTFNQCGVAGALDRIGEGEAITPDLTTVLTEVTALTLDQARAAFDRLSGEAHGSLAGVLLEGHALYGQAVSRRIADRREAIGADRLRGGAWVRAYGADSDLDGDGNAHAADFRQRGLAAGFDAWGSERVLVGASFNALRVDADFRPGDRAEADAKNVSLYASVQGESAYLDAVTSFAWWDNDITRRIEVGSIGREARSEYGGHRFATHLEAGWAFAPGQNQQLTPLVGIEYAKLDQEGFREEGAQDLNLVGRSQDVERTTASAGVRWTAVFERGDWTFEPTLQVRWLHAMGDGHAEQTLAFAGAPDVGYRVRGVSWPGDRGLLGVGLQMRHGDALDLFIDVDYQKGGGLEAKNVGAGLRWRW